MAGVKWWLQIPSLCEDSGDEEVPQPPDAGPGVTHSASAVVLLEGMIRLE